MPDGALASYTAQYGGTTALYAETIRARDGDGRITERAETIGAVTHTWTYGYDTAGRLTDVGEDGSPVSHYAYDVDDNRTSFMGVTGTTFATYDAQDRLLTYGGVSYSYGANGELETRREESETTQYGYDVFGNLLSATLPDGTALMYVVDGQNRRVGTRVNGTLTAGYLYQDELNTVAQLDGTGNLVSRFVFGSKPNVPDYFASAAGTFRIFSDHVGSPRLIVNTANGIVEEEIDYDEFGNVTKDTQPGLTPFGFAGGLYDPNTRLVRFGARDYDPSVGRWTSKDPAKFVGGTNFYVYVMDDPIDGTDPNGQLPNLACLQYLSATCNQACEGNLRPDCWFYCMLGEVGAAIADPTYCVEPRNSPRCEGVFEVCLAEATADVLCPGGGPLDKSGPFYNNIRMCMLKNNCSY